MSIQNGNHELSLRGRELAKFLKDFAKEHKVTQSQIGKSIGRGQSYVSDRMRGLVAMDYDTMCAIADLAGVSVDYLFAIAHAHVKSALSNRPQAPETPQQSDQ